MAPYSPTRYSLFLHAEEADIAHGGGSFPRLTRLETYVTMTGKLPFPNPQNSPRSHAEASSPLRLRFGTIHNLPLLGALYGACSTSRGKVEAGRLGSRR